MQLDAKTIARILTAVGALNWGLVGLARFDLVAALVGKRFGQTNALTRLVYTAVGASGAYLVSRMASEARD